MLRFPLHLLLLLVFAPAWGSGPGIAEDRAAQASRRILTVGPGRALKNPSDAARLARDGTLVMIDAGSYLSDTAVWRQNDLTLVGTGGMAKLMSRGQVAEGKAIWVIKGDRVRVENIEFADARSDAFNGAGIRFEGTDLTLRNCGFHDNQMGILTGANPHSTIRIEGSEFYRNTVDYQRHGRLGHNIYVGRVRRFVLRDSHIHSAETGHQVKSRADQNFILYNRITDESGHASYLVDLPQGGRALIMGNLLYKSADAENEAAVAFAAEANRNVPGHELYVVHNTLVTDRPHTVLVRNHSTAVALVANNLVQGDALPLQGNGNALSNLVLQEVGLRNLDRFDYRLSPLSPAVDAALQDLATADGKPLIPSRQYLHPRSSEPRSAAGARDIGAYEFLSEPTSSK